MNRFKSKLWLIALISLSSLLAPFIHAFIKPYRLRVEVTMRHEEPTAVEVYFSNSRINPNYFRGQNVAPLIVQAAGEQTAQLSRLVAYIASDKPVTGLRLDPSTNANTITLSALSIHSLFGDATLGLPEILSLIEKGSGITQLRASGSELRFATEGNDAHFWVPIPASIGVPSKAEARAWYALAWLIALGLLLLMKISIFTPHPTFNNNGARPIRLGKAVLYLPALSERVFNVVGLAVLGYTLIRFIGLTVGMDFSHVQKSFDRDRISTAIPGEVLQIQSILKRQPVQAFVLAGDMGHGEDESTIYQRATEYLYPIRVTAQATWVMARSSDTQTAGRADCHPRDQQGEIILYECAK